MRALHLPGSIGRLPLRDGLLLRSIILVCFTLATTVFAVSPAPDGGYPGNNTAEGSFALLNLTAGMSNTAVGFKTLYQNTTSNYNTAIGAQTMQGEKGAQNTGTGYKTLINNHGSYNTANGCLALTSKGSSNNTAIGQGALYAFLEASENTAVGVSALAGNYRGSQNTGVGFATFAAHRRQENDIALGHEAGIGVGGFHNIEIGTRGGYDPSNTTRIGDVQTRTFIAGISGTAVAGESVVVNGNGRLGTATSSVRFKKEVEPMAKASEGLLALKAVSFQYKSDPTGTPQFGLIAEEVAKVNPDLVTRDREGEIYGVRYEAVNAMLLNEFLKQHKAFLEARRKVQEQQAAITQLKSTMAQQRKDLEQKVARLITRFDEQVSQLRSVSVRLEATVQMVSNNQ